MNLIRWAFISFCDRRLRIVREQADVFEREHASIFASYRNIFETAYTIAHYWHGTGRYHYAHAMGDRFEVADSAQVVDVLDDILTYGIRPHTEPLLRIDGKICKTISLAPSRMYGSLYGRLHLTPPDRLAYMFGSNTFWFRTMLAAFFLEMILRPRDTVRLLLRDLRIPSYGSARRWKHAFSKDDRVFPVYKTASDIPENYPILIGIRAIPTCTLNPMAAVFEARSEQVLTAHTFTHIEVPIDHIEETLKCLKEKGIDIPVVPFEMGEVWCARQNMETLLWPTLFGNCDTIES